MAEVKHADGSVTVGWIPEEDEIVEAPEATEPADKPKRGRKTTDKE